MKNFLFILAIFFALMSCAHNTSPNNTLTGAETSTGTKMAQMQKVAPPSLPIPDFPVFEKNFWEEIILENDICMVDFCVKSGTKMYQDVNGDASVLALMKRKNTYDSEGGIIDGEKEFVKFFQEKPILQEGEPEEYSYYKDFWDYLGEEEKAKIQEEWEDIEYFAEKITISPAKKSILREELITLVIAEEQYSYLPNGYILYTNTSGACAASETIQKIYDDKQNEIEDFSKIFYNIPEKIVNLPVELAIDWKGMKAVNRWAFLEGYSEIFHHSIEEEFSIYDDLSKILSNNHIGIADEYSILFKEYPGVSFVYKNNLWRSDSYLTGTLATLPVNEKNEVIDLEATKKILESFTYGDDERKSVNLRKSNSEDIEPLYIDTLTAEMLPLFRLNKLSNGDALLSTTKDYEFFTTAELCKPVVYTYDKNNSKNSLSVELPKGGYYTKLIPNFSYGNTWDFQTTMHSEIFSENQKLGYLYYSARVPDYRFNTDGWQVYGRDMQKFLEEKLDYIGFNATEKKDFIDFWKTEFHNEMPYFVSFKFDNDIEAYASLNFKRKPVSQIRVLLEAYPLKNKIHKQFLYPMASSHLDEKLLKKFYRSHEFDVLEWGWVVQKDFNSEIIVR